MSDKVMVVVRWVVLASAIISLLQATLLFGAFQRLLFEPWQAMNERAGRRVPEIMRDPRMQRAWPLFMAGVLFAAWWYLGTPAGAALLRRAAD